MVKRLVVGAHYGFRDWLIQRITAVVMALYTVFFAIRLLCMPAFDNASWRALFTQGFAGGFTKFVTFLFLLSLFYHAWIGVRDIWMDYVKPVSVRLALHAITVLLLIGYAAWAAQILWRL